MSDIIIRMIDKIINETLILFEKRKEQDKLIELLSKILNTHTLD